MSDESLLFPDPPEPASDIRLFPAAKRNSEELVIDLGGDIVCVVCEGVPSGSGTKEPMLVVASADGKLEAFYCSLQCIYIDLATFHTRKRRRRASNRKGE